MSNIYLTGCAFAIATIISIVFFLKKRVNNIETKVFGYLTLLNVLESAITTCIVIVAITSNITFVLEILNRSDVIVIISWCSLMFYYIYNISHKKGFQYIKYFIIVFNIILYILAFILHVTIINYNGILNSTGPLTTLGLVGATIYIILMIIAVITKNNEKIKFNEVKYIPLYFFIVLMIIIAILRVIVPEINFISILLSFVILLMYHTIENPDMKMIEQLNIAKDTAEKANRAKSDFLSSMSHEIRTPLNAIVGFSECIKQADSLEEAKENATDIVTASNTLLEIVNGILDISKIESGKLELVETNYSTKELLLEIEKLIKARIGDKPLDFKVNVAEDLPLTLYGDHFNVKKILINLLTNAIKYTEHGYILLNIKCVNVGNDICRLIISVKDTGRGIKAENIDKLFIKFTRLEEDKNTTTEGTGLGLAITKQLVEMMNGKIVVNSVYGEGSEFTVAIDQRISLEEVKKEIIEEITDLDLTGKNILIVDDNKLNLKVASKLLLKYNPTVDTCESGFECIEKIKNGQNYDLILMDDMMPKMKGTETFTRLKQIDNFNIPTIILTANAINGMKEHYLSYGFNDYLSKPIDNDALYNILRKYVGQEQLKIESDDLIYKDYTGKKVLIVDDNKINIKIAAKAISSYNFEIETVLSGQECVEKIKEKNYDLIFMDYMMPDMDGIETLNKLKEIPDFNTKVVALTADAVDGAREKFLNAGFDEYVSKPIDKEHLDNVINSLLNNKISDIPEELYDMSKSLDQIKIKNEISSSESDFNLEEENSDIEYLKQNGIDIDNGINLLGDIETYNETLNDFLDEIENRVSKLTNYKNNNDLANYAIEVHALKSDSKYLGFKKLAELALNHEIKSKENNLGYINNNFKDLIDELNRILDIVKKYNR